MLTGWGMKPTQQKLKQKYVAKNFRRAFKKDFGFLTTWIIPTAEKEETTLYAPIITVLKDDWFEKLKLEF